jgi:hypothetical protein
MILVVLLALFLPVTLYYYTNILLVAKSHVSKKLTTIFTIILKQSFVILCIY